MYDASDDDSVLSASLASVLFASVDPAMGTLSVLEIVTIVNRSDRTYVPGSGVMSFLRFGLPEGAGHLQLDTLLPGADFIQVDRGFALIASLPPGEHEVLYTYRFPYSGTEAEFTKSLRYGADLFRVLVPEELAELSGAAMAEVETAAIEMGTTTIGDRRYQLVAAVDLERGAQLTARLAGLPEAQRTTQTLGAAVRRKTPVSTGYASSTPPRSPSASSWSSPSASPPGEVDARSQDEFERRSP